MHGHGEFRWRGRGRRRVWDSEDLEQEVDANVREAMRQAKVNLKHNVKPAMKHLRRQLKEMDIEGTVGQAMDQLRAWAANQPPRAEDTSEARLTILRMVQEGKITAEEAGRLLDAL